MLAVSGLGPSQGKERVRCLYPEVEKFEWLRIPSTSHLDGTPGVEPALLGTLELGALETATAFSLRVDGEDRVVSGTTLEVCDPRADAY